MALNEKIIGSNVQITIKENLCDDYINQLLQSYADAGRDFKALVTDRKAILVESKQIQADIFELMSNSFVSLVDVQMVRANLEKQNLKALQDIITPDNTSSIYKGLFIT